MATINAVQPPAWPSRERSDWSGLEHDGPLELSLVLKCLWLFSTISSLIVVPVIVRVFSSCSLF